MALTLAQAQPLSQSKLAQLVIDEFRKSALIDQLMWDTNATSNGGASFTYTYNRVTTLPTAAPRLINADYVAQEPLTTLISSVLGIMGGSFQIDRALAANEHQVIDLVTHLINQKTEATVAEFHNQFINGNNGLGTGEFDGLEFLLTGGAQELNLGVIDLDSSADITSNWRTFLEALRRLRALMDGAPTLYLMSQNMYSVFQSVMDRAGIQLLSKENYGNEVSVWGPSMVMALGDIPATSNPIIAEPAGVTSVFAVRLGMDGVHGIAPQGSPIVRTYLPNFTDAAALQTGSVELIGGIAYKATRSAAVLRNIDIA
jgi:hypothetical protein